VKGVPDPKIHRYEMGNKKREFSGTMALVSNSAVQIRHNALEAARIAANRVLEKFVGRENFMLKIIPYPHQIIREHKRVNVAQADRFQEGMKKAYGKPAYVAARIRNKQPVMIAEVDKDNIEYAKTALKRASAKFPSTCRIVVKEI